MFVSGIGLLLAMTVGMQARAQIFDTHDSTVGAGSARGSLAGHEFIPSSFIRDPFVRTFLRTSLGFGITTSPVAPLVTVGGKPVVGPQGSLLFAVLDAEYQHAIRDWLAVRGRLNVIGRMADETPVLIAQGITLYSGFDLGWLFRLSESQRYSLSGALGVKNTSTTDVYLQRFIDGILDSGEILPQNKLVLATPTLRISTGIQGAYVLSTLAGVTIAANLDYGETAVRGEPDRWYYSVAAAVDFNLSKTSGVPVGFVVGVKTGSGPGVQGTEGRSEQDFFGRLAYTGTREFALGLDMSYALIPTRDMPEKQGFVTSTIDIRLFF
jgi:hypothetical protein